MGAASLPTFYDDSAIPIPGPWFYLIEEPLYLDESSSLWVLLEETGIGLAVRDKWKQIMKRKGNHFLQGMKRARTTRDRLQGVLASCKEDQIDVEKGLDSR